MKLLLKQKYTHSTKGDERGRVNQEFGISRYTLQFSSVQFSRSVMSDSLRPCELQHSLSITNSWSPPKPMSIESVMPSDHLILCHPLLLLPSIFPSIGSFQMSQLFASGGQSIGVSAQHHIKQINNKDYCMAQVTIFKIL